MAKIKTAKSSHHHTKPKTIDRRSFDKVYWPYIPLVLMISLLLAVGLGSGNLQAYAKHPGGRVLSYSTSMSISGLLSDTNGSRAANGVAGLSLNEQLDAAAQASADDMVARNYWSHNTPDGDPPWIWVNAQGYSYQKLGQNLATGFSNEQSTIDGWMNSPPHRENLLDPSFTQVGFGFANNPNYTSAGGGPMTIVVAFYGQPRVLAAATPAPASHNPAPSTQSSAPAVPSQQAPSPAQESPAAAQPVATQPEAKPVPVNTQTNITSVPQVKQSRIGLALANSRLAPAATSITIMLAILVLGFWLTRHLLAFRRFVLKGEKYVLSHPLTDIGLLILGCLLFILSQTAGLVR
jgi:hypothetical protein